MITLHGHVCIWAEVFFQDYLIGVLERTCMCLQNTAVTRIRTGVAAATTQSTNHYTITASCPLDETANISTD